MFIGFYIFYAWIYKFNKFNVTNHIFVKYDLLNIPTYMYVIC